MQARHGARIHTAECGRQAGVTRVTIQNWLKKRNLIVPAKLIEPDFGASKDPELLAARIKELEKRLARSEIEKEILKKATAYFASQSH